MWKNSQKRHTFDKIFLTTGGIKQKNSRSEGLSWVKLVETKRFHLVERALSGTCLRPTDKDIFEHLFIKYNLVTLKIMPYAATLWLYSC